LQVIDFLQEQVEKQDIKLRKLARPNPDAHRLKKMPGFDVLSAMMFLAEIGDISRFQNARQLTAFIGLVPRVYASGEVCRRGRITKQGSKLLRCILVQCAWAAIRKSPNLRSRFASISRRRGKSIAIVAIARKLAEVAFHIVKEKAEFSEERLATGLARPLL
jgi:transposase